MEDLARVKKTMNPKLKIAGVIANRVDLRRNLTKQGLQEMKEHFGNVLFDTYVSNNTSIPLSISIHKTVRELNWYSPVLTQLAKITKELEKRMGF
jgi:chromosome partitioning protein